MNVRNCRNCGKLFNYVLGPIICPDCMNAQEELFQVAKAYVQDHPGCDIQELSENVDADINQIRQWIREERLQFSEDSPIRIACEACGAMIRSGRYCEACKNNMSNGLKSAFGMNKPAPEPIQKKRESDGNKMRFL
ncbi:MAG: flagellar protein [Lachnospiraceae bacterium]|nr:flagellar protein [Lachnospiraceae bacterium]